MERDNGFLALRRQFLRAWAALPLALASSCVALPAWAQAAPTPECGDSPALTTQVYFPGEAQNEDDFLFHPDLLMKIRNAGGARDGRFDFVLKLA